MSTTITIPNVELTLDQLVSVVRDLEPDARVKVARALLSDEMDARLALLIKHLAEKTPVIDISDTDINAEIRLVRQRRH
jgi:hypothetical protein